MSPVIPLSEPYLGYSDRARVSKAIRSGWLTQAGKEVKIMEESLVNFYGFKTTSKYSVTSTSNGTTALHLALLAINVKAGDEVIIPNFAYVAVANAVLYVGAIPVVVDVDIDTWNISTDQILSKINAKTKAVIIVDNYGRLNDYSKLRKIVPAQIKIIQDAAESFPGNVHKQFVKNYGDIVTISFYANKIITAGEGGAIIAPKDMIEKIKYLKNQAQIPGSNFNHGDIGFNYRISNLHAAIFNAQWNKLKKNEKKRQKIFEKYYIALKKENIIFSTNDHENSAKWLFTIKIENLKIPMLKIRNSLASRGIESRPGFTPFSKMLYLKKASILDKNYPNSDVLANSVISLPTYPGLKSNQIDFIVASLGEIIFNEK